ARLDDLFAKAEETFKDLKTEIARQEPRELFCDAALLKKELSDFSVIELGNQAYLANREEDLVEFHTKPQPSFNKKFGLLTEDLLEHQENGYSNTIFCASQQQAQRFHDIFEAEENTEKGQLNYKTAVLPLYQGFIDEVGKQVSYTDHQIFERYHRFRLKTGYAKKQ